MLTPKEIKEQLDQCVIGQENAKITLSVAIYNHLKRVNNSSYFDALKVKLVKNNVLLLGPSGSGKTELIRSLAKICELPFAIVDAATITENGCKGSDFSDCIKYMLRENNGDVRLVERGIIFVDEIDKKTKCGMLDSKNKTGISDQQSLLKLVEGLQLSFDAEEVGVKSYNNPKEVFQPNPECKGNDESTAYVSTDNMLFIFGGAFVGIENIIKQRLHLMDKPAEQVLGLNSKCKEQEQSYDKLLQQLSSEDVIEYGLIPELMGRIPVVVTLQKLTLKDYERILVEPKNSVVHQFQALYSLQGAQLIFEPTAIREIAKQAMEEVTGARALSGIISELLLETTYNLPNLIKGKETRIVITRECITQGSAPKIIIA